MSALADVPDGVLVLAEWHLRGGMPGWHDDEPRIGRTWPWRLRIGDARAFAWVDDVRDPPVLVLDLDDVRRELGRRLFGGWGAAAEVAQSARDGVPVYVLALVAPWSTTAGTLHTARLAQRARLWTDVRFCPAARGPQGARS